MVGVTAKRGGVETMTTMATGVQGAGAAVGQFGGHPVLPLLVAEVAAELAAQQGRPGGGRRPGPHGAAAPQRMEAPAVGAKQHGRHRAAVGVLRRALRPQRAQVPDAHVAGAAAGHELAAVEAEVQAGDVLEHAFQCRRGGVVQVVQMQMTRFTGDCQPSATDAEGQSNHVVRHAASSFEQAAAAIG